MFSPFRQALVNRAARVAVQQKRTFIRPPGLPPVEGEDPAVTDQLRNSAYGLGFYKYIVIGMLWGAVAQMLVPHPTTKEQIDTARGFIKTGKLEPWKA